MKKRSAFKNISLLVILLALLLVVLYSGFQILESAVLHPQESSGSREPSKTIIRDGVEYFPRQDITVVMVLGIDQHGPVESSNYYRNEGSADSIMLLIFDDKEQHTSVLYLNRDTMLEMDVLGVQGDYAGTAYGQLALAHTYGTGLEDSSENVKNTIMKFLHGLTIDYYMAMNMDAIPILNDAVGGVTVNVVDDFSKVNPSITMGTLKLRGEQVIDYVRTRKDVGDQKNVTRMARQREYVNGFIHALYDSIHEDPMFLLSLYEELGPYIVTDCSGDTLNNLLERYADFEIGDAITPEGENIIEDGHYAFYTDEEKLDDLIVEIFYRPK